MANPNLPERQPFFGDQLPQGSNALGLDGAKLGAVARSIQKSGISREQLTAIYFGDQNERNPLLMVWIDDTAELQAEHMGLDGRSFRRGAALALHLIAEASGQDVPYMGLSARTSAGTYLKQPGSPEAAQEACDGLLRSQPELDEAFRIALQGMPGKTDGVAARFGAGAALLGVMSAAQFGSANMEIRPLE